MFNNIKMNLYRLFRNDAHPDPDISKGGSSDEDDDNLLAHPSELDAEILKQMQIPDARMQRYRVYREMDRTDLASAVVDLYSEDASPRNPDTGKVIWASSKNGVIQNKIMQMFERLKLEENTLQIIREMALMGDDFERLIYATGEDKGVQAMHFANQSKVHRRDDKYNRLEGFVQDGKKFRSGEKNSKDNAKVTMSYPWDYVHFRNLGKERSTKYGSSILQNSIRPYRQLLVAEDEGLLYRINRLPDRLVFKVDIGKQNEIEGRKTVQRFKNKFKKSIVLDSTQGHYDHQRDPLTPIEDIFLGLQRDSITSVEKLDGSANVSDVQDLTYFIDKFFASVRAPKAFFGFESQFENNPKTVLTNQNIRYARAVQRLQNSYMDGLRTVCETHLTLMDSNFAQSKYNWFQEGNDFSIHMEPVSYLAELERMELFNIRSVLADTLLRLNDSSGLVLDPHAWTKYVMQDVLQLSDAKIKKIMLPKTQVPAPEDAQNLESVDRIISSSTSNVIHEEVKNVIMQSPALQNLLVNGVELFTGNTDYKPKSDAIFTNRSDEPNKILENATDDFDIDTDTDKYIDREISDADEVSEIDVHDVLVKKKKRKM